MPRKKTEADLMDKPKKIVSKKTGKTVKRSSSVKKVNPVKAKPKIKIKKVVAKTTKIDGSVVNLKKKFHQEEYDEDNTEEVEELKIEDMDFDWDDLLDSGDDVKKSKKKKTLKKKKEAKSGLFSFLSFGHKKEKKHKEEKSKDEKGHKEDKEDKNHKEEKKGKTKKVKELKLVEEAEKVDKVKIKKNKHEIKFHKKDRQIKKAELKHVDKLMDKDMKNRQKDLDITKDLPAIDRHKGASMKVYRKLAVGFVLLAIALVGVIFYFSFAKATVVVKLKDEIVNQTIAINVYDRGEDYIIPEEAIRGIIKKIELEQSKVYDVVGSEVIGEEVTGTVTVINNYVKNQPLVATTRLLSPDGKLFRLKNSVNVPAGKSLEVQVYADKMDQDMVVGDTSFIIPGLWEGLQDKIYAESKAGDITFKKKLKKILKQEEVDSALVNLKDILIAKAKLDIDDTYSNYTQKLYQIDETAIDYEIDADVQDEVDNFTITMTATILVVAFDNSQVYELAQADLTSNLADGKQLLGLRPEEFEYKLLEVDLERDIADIEVQFNGKIAFLDETKIINKEEIVNLTKEELASFLSQMPEIETFDIKITPSFVNKTPSLVDRIKVEVLN